MKQNRNCQLMKTNNYKQEFILDCAENVFFRNGYKNTTIRKITTSANINIAMLHYYFRSKEHLFEQVVLRKIAGVESAIAEKINSSNAALTLEDALRLQINMIFDNKNFYRFIYAELLMGENESARETIQSFILSAREKMTLLLSRAISGDNYVRFDAELSLISFFGTSLHAITVMDEADDELLKLRLLNHFKSLHVRPLPNE